MSAWPICHLPHVIDIFRLSGRFYKTSFALLIFAASARSSRAAHGPPRARGMMLPIFTHARCEHDDHQRANITLELILFLFYTLLIFARAFARASVISRLLPARQHCRPPASASQELCCRAAVPAMSLMTTMQPTIAQVFTTRIPAELIYRAAITDITLRRFAAFRISRIRSSQASMFE